jgi:hypothetical protein
MVPTLILVGLLLGRWWKITPVVAAAVWCTVLLADRTISPSGVGAALLVGFLNTAVGVVVHQVARSAVRSLHPRDKHA